MCTYVYYNIILLRCKCCYIKCIYCFYLHALKNLKRDLVYSLYTYGIRDIVIKLGTTCR